MIGSLRHMLRLQEKASTPDGGGGFTYVWQDVASNPEVYASIEALSGREDLRHYRLLTAVTHRLQIRYRDDVTADMRLTDGVNHYEIAAVLDRDGRKKLLDIVAVSSQGS